MDIDTFWSLIEQSRTAPSVQITPLVSDERDEAQSAALTELLMPLPLEEIVAFDHLFFEFLSASETDSLFGAAMVINGSGSYDGYFYFRIWLIGQGKEVFENALRDPETLISIVEQENDNHEWSSLPGAADLAYLRRTGTPLESVELTIQLPEVARYPETLPVRPTWETVYSFYPRLSEYMWGPQSE